MIRSLHSLPQAEDETERENASGGRMTSPITTLEGLASARNAGKAVVEGVDAPAALRRRLLEIGFTEGCPVRFVMATPFGDPLVFSLRGASIALRKSEARCVRVRV
jgi:ferrous iron transport protein A